MIVYHNGEAIGSVSRKDSEFIITMGSRSWIAGGMTIGSAITELKNRYQSYQLQHKWKLHDPTANPQRIRGINIE
jgi:hypothetical protein